MVNAFTKIFGGVKPDTFVKYMNYLFVWPGIVSAKYVIIVISFLPLIFLAAYRRGRKMIRLSFAIGLGCRFLLLWEYAFLSSGSALLPVSYSYPFFFRCPFYSLHVQE